MERRPVANCCNECGADFKSASFDKVSCVEEFMKFTTKLANDGGFAKSVVRFFK